MNEKNFEMISNGAPKVEDLLRADKFIDISADREELIRHAVELGDTEVARLLIADAMIALKKSEEPEEK